jgi:hypothetical protein
MRWMWKAESSVCMFPQDSDNEECKIKWESSEHIPNNKHENKLVLYESLF